VSVEANSNAVGALTNAVDYERTEMIKLQGRMKIVEDAGGAFDLIATAVGTTDATGLRYATNDLKVKYLEMKTVLGTNPTSGLRFQVGQNQTAIGDFQTALGVGTMGSGNYVTSSDFNSFEDNEFETYKDDVNTKLNLYAKPADIAIVDTKINELRFATPASVTTVNGRVTALSTRVTTLEGKGYDGSKAVYVNSLYNNAKGASAQWSACYPDVGGKLRDMIRRNCESRGAGWTHETGWGNNLADCFKQKGVDDKGGPLWHHFKMGVCVKKPPAVNW